jgi:hypothetical protein
MAVVHEITRDEHGNQIGSDGEITVTLMDGGRMFKRRAIKGVGTEAAEEVCWLVAELDGVRAFQHGRHIVVTNQDMNP